MGRANNHEGDAEKQQLLAAIVESSQDAIVSKDLNSCVTSWNRGAQLVFGYSADEMIGQSVMLLIPPDRHTEETEILDRIRRGERIDHFETLRRHKDGHLINVSLTISPIRGEGGRIVGASKIARDITERIRAEETQRMLLREVNHRSKNLLAVVEAMVRKTARSTPPEEIVSRISQRLQALSAIQNLLIYSEWRGVDLATLARAQTQPYCDDRVEIAGPKVVLQPPAAQAIGLALHELATNSVRHDVLGADGGRITFRWRLDPGPQGAPVLKLEWNEMGRASFAPKNTSFGTTILKRATEDALGGTVDTSHGPEGYCWRMEAAADGLLS